MKLTDKNFYLLKTATGSITHYIYYGDNTVDDTPAGLPGWIVVTDETDAEGRDRLKLVFSTTTAGTFGPYDFGDLNVTVEVVALRFTELAGCCDDQTLNIAWFNRIGGWQSWQFRRKRTFEITSQGDAKVFTNDLTKYYSELPDKYSGELVSANLNSQQYVDVCAAMKYSLQAYVYNDDTDAFDIPILIDQESFPKYFDRQKLFIPFSFRFIYSERLNIQTQ